MYVRKKKNKSGSVSVQVIDKSSGKYKVKKTIGSSADSTEIERLVNEGRAYILRVSGQGQFDFTDYRAMTEKVLDNIQSMRLIGVEAVLGKLFDEIGFNQIEDELFRHLVLYRLVYPSSKLKTTEYLYRYSGHWYTKDDVYRYMDKLYNTQKEQVQAVSFNHTKKLLGSSFEVVFYDVTTLYFEIDDQDEYRTIGFSKEGKHRNPQILLGLLVSVGGYPLAYEIFPGNKYEGHTMLGVLNTFKIKYELKDLIVVADSGLLTKSNIEELSLNGYRFILGARIKNENKEIKQKILALDLKDGQNSVINKNDLKLIIGYSEKRAKKDRHNREKGVKRLQDKLRSGKLTKASINNRGYNKYLRLTGEIEVSLDLKKYEADARWDGLKGYLTNADLTTNEILENYHHLWRIEKAFRVAKTDLRIRPIYHRLQRRVEAHICLNFVAYKVYKELERQLKDKKTDLSAEKVIEIIQNIHQIKVFLPGTNSYYTKTLILTDEQRYIANLFDF